MRSLICLLPLLFIFRLAAAQAEAPTYQGVDGKTYVRLMAKPPKNMPTDSGYDSRMLIPHRNPKTDLWGYVRRGSLELVVPHRFKNAGRFHNGFAIALERHFNGGENVYRLDTTGRIECLYKDDEGYGQEMDKNRWIEDHLFLRTEDRIIVHAPSGALLMDTIIPEHFDRMTYPAAGFFAIESDSTMTFFSYEEGRLAEWDLNRYEVMVPNLQQLEESPKSTFYIILDIETGKVGILNHRGSLVVPIEWEIHPLRWKLPHNLGKIELYSPCRDSLYLGYRDNHYSLMHLDGRTIFAYNDSVLPSDRGHYALRARNWTHVWYDEPEIGWASAYADMDRNLYYPCTGCDLQLLDANHLFMGLPFENWMIDLESGEEKILSLPNNLSIVTTEVIEEPGSTSWIFRDRASAGMGIMSPSGKVLLKLQNTSGSALGPYPQSFHALQAISQESNTFSKAYFAPDGRLLFGGKFKTSDPGKPQVGTMLSTSMISDDRRQIHPNKRYDSCDIHPYMKEGEYIPNMLLYVEEVISPGEIRKGYMDSYGVKYY